MSFSTDMQIKKLSQKMFLLLNVSLRYVFIIAEQVTFMFEVYKPTYFKLIPSKIKTFQHIM